MKEGEKQHSSDPEVSIKDSVMVKEIGLNFINDRIE